MKNIVILLGLALLLACCEEDPDPNYGESKTVVTLRALPGMQVYPNGTKMGVYKIGGVSGNRTYTLVDSLIFLPLDTNEDANEASFTYNGEHPVWLRIEPTSSPPISLPLKYQSPFESSTVDFWIDKPEQGFINLNYQPNFWMDFALFTNKSKSEISGPGLFRIGNEFNRLITASISFDRNQIGDTIIKPTAWRYLVNNEEFPIFLIEGSSDGSDSLLQTIHFGDLNPHDTTFVFYDYDKDSIHVSRR